MKQINLLLMATISVAIFSCSKDKIQQPGIDSSNPATTINAPEYNEKNSTAVEWNQLPENLRNAEVLPVEKQSTNKVLANYKYFIGTWGGSGGSGYSFYPAASTDKIYAVGVRSGIYIDQLIVWYIRTNGTLYVKNAGGAGGSYYIQFLSSDEYISAIGGRSGSYLDRLTIYTNKKSFSYGGNGGSYFYQSLPSSDQILGFYGGAGKYVDRIGAWVYSK